MSKLPKQISKNKFVYKQIKRTDKTALYSQHYWKQDERGAVKHLQQCGYEVFMIRNQKETLMPNGRTIKAKEKFPSNEEFGRYAWSFLDINLANKKYDELEQSSVKDGKEVTKRSSSAIVIKVGELSLKRFTNGTVMGLDKNNKPISPKPVLSLACKERGIDPTNLKMKEMIPLLFEKE
jgi:hypothetical protein